MESPDGDGLTLDSFSIDENSLVSNDIDNGGKLSFEGPVVNPGNSADLDESVISLCYVDGTMCLVIKN